MSTLELTKTKLKQGVWEGIVLNGGDTQPLIEVTHQNNKVDSISLTHNPDAGHWVLSIPIPADAISDGAQTLLIHDAKTDTQIGHVTLIADDALGDDIRAEVELLRAELDMLKRAFRRHCLETD